MLIITLKHDPHPDRRAVIRHPDGTLLGTVELVEIRGDKARVGFTFPTDHPVNRQSIDAERFDAAHGAWPDAPMPAGAAG